MSDSDKRDVPARTEPEAELARRLVGHLDLTNLDETCTESAVEALCVKALGGEGVPPVAAVCIWPTFVKIAVRRLSGSPVKVATVVNFPTGTENVERVVEAAAEAVRDGADEIDLVMPHEAFLAGDEAAARATIEAVRERLDGEALLKVILETGALGSNEAIARASRLAITAGADFIKTSTGKIPISATPQAARIMLDAIHESPRPVGLKPSGGIRTLDDARTYLALAEEAMGADWPTPENFRIGASGLHAALVAAIAGEAAQGAASAQSATSPQSPEGASY